VLPVVIAVADVPLVAATTGRKEVVLRIAASAARPVVASAQSVASGEIGRQGVLAFSAARASEGANVPSVAADSAGNVAIARRGPAVMDRENLGQRVSVPQIGASRALVSAARGGSVVASVDRAVPVVARVQRVPDSVVPARVVSAKVELADLAVPLVTHAHLAVPLAAHAHPA
jgi:hypothetical protein